MWKEKRVRGDQTDVQTDECVLCVSVGAEASSELAGSSLQLFLPKYYWAKLPDMISI